MRKILIPVDGSDLSLDAVRYALGLRQAGLPADFVLANVQEPATLYELLTVRDPQLLEGVATGSGDHSLERARALFDAAGVGYETEIGSGDPAHTLLDIAERYGCDAIVVGARGHGGLVSRSLGSVAQVLVHDSPLPVIVVKHAEPDAPRTQPERSEPVDSLQPVVGLA